MGDPDQSIYAWRGADIRNILDFEQDYADATVIKLEQNYRSTQPILSGAAAVISNNFDRKEKDLFTDREGGSPIRFYEANDDREEAQFVVRNILSANRGEDVPFGHMAILYRTNAQSRAFEEELLKYDVPYTIVGGQRFYERAEIKDILCYLRLLVNPRDDAAVRRIVNKPARGIGKASLEKVESLAVARGLSLMEAMREAVETKLVGRSTAKLEAFLQMMEGFRVLAGGRSSGGWRPRRSAARRPDRAGDGRHGLYPGPREGGHPGGRGAARQPAGAALERAGLPCGERGRARGGRSQRARALPRSGRVDLGSRPVRGSRGPHLHDDGPLGEGARVSDRLPGRDGGTDLSPRVVDSRRGGARGGASALLRRDDPRHGASLRHLRRGAAPLRRSDLSVAEPLPAGDPRRADRDARHREPRRDAPEPGPRGAGGRARASTTPTDRRRPAKARASPSARSFAIPSSGAARCSPCSGAT